MPICKPVVSLVPAFLCLLATVAAAAGDTADVRLKFFPIPTPDGEPLEIVTGADALPYFVLQNASSVARLGRNGQIDEFPLPTFGFPSDITLGPDDNVWFTEGNGRVGRITPAGEITEYPFSPSDSAIGITGGPGGGTIWFTAVGDRVWRLRIEDGRLQPFDLAPGTFPGDITAGADGNLWFTQSSGIGRLSPAGTYTAFGVGEVTPFAITRGHDGNVWFTERFGQRIGKITPDGELTFYPTELHTLDSIVAGPDNGLWFTSFGDDRIAHITTDGVIRPTPEIPGSTPTGLYADAAGVWFLGYGNDRLYRLGWGASPH